MRLSQLEFRLPPEGEGASTASDDSPGYGWLCRAGYVVELGPGLVAGTPLFQRLLERVETRLVRGLMESGAHEACLPASEGEALVNLAAQTGWAGVRGGLFSRGAGFREATEGAVGLFDLSLYRRLDAVQWFEASPAGAGGHEVETPASSSASGLGSGGTDLGPLLQGLLRDLAAAGLPGVRIVGQGDELELRLQVQRISDALSSPAAPAAQTDVPTDAPTDAPTDVRLGRLLVRRLPADAGGARVVLLSLDLHAVVGALAERHHDARGLVWPVASAPCLASVLFVTGESAEGRAAARETAYKLESQARASGVELLVDDRRLEPALQRLTAERLGLPYRVLCGPTVGRGEVVLETRRGGPPQRVPAAEVVGQLLASTASDAHDEAERRRRLRRATW